MSDTTSEPTTTEPVLEAIEVQRAIARGHSIYTHEVVIWLDGVSFHSSPMTPDKAERVAQRIRRTAGIER